jgi:hypothetical protein
VLLTTFYSGDQIEKNEMSGACSTYGERRSTHRVLVGKTEGKRPLGRHSRRWEDNIKLDLQELRWSEWTVLIWLRTGTGGGLLCMR